MSATIIAFPTKQLAFHNCSSRYGIDVSPVDKRGFVILDACVPMSLVVELMGLIDLYQDKQTAPVRGGVPAHDRPVFDFDMNQPEPRGLVLIDACVPEQLAREFVAIAETEKTPATAA
jgi:hypothetical protein